MDVENLAALNRLPNFSEVLLPKPKGNSIELLGVAHEFLDLLLVVFQVDEALLGEFIGVGFLRSRRTHLILKALQKIKEVLLNFGAKLLVPSRPEGLVEVLDQINLLAVESEVLYFFLEKVVQVLFQPHHCLSLNLLISQFFGLNRLELLVTVIDVSHLAFVALQKVLEASPLLRVREVPVQFFEVVDWRRTQQKIIKRDDQVDFLDFQVQLEFVQVLDFLGVLSLRIFAVLFVFVLLEGAH